MTAPRPHEHDAASAALDEAVALAFRVLKGVMVALLLLVALSGVFTVRPGEVAFVRRLGRLDPEKHEAGGHLALPFLDEVARVDLRTRKLGLETFDLRRSEEERLTGKVGPRSGGLDPKKDGYVISGDANIAHLALSVRLSARPTTRALVAAVEWEPVVRALFERAVVQAAASRPADQLLGAGKAQFADEVKRLLQDALDRQGVDLGLLVEGVDLDQDLVPPQVRPAFEAVTRAAQDSDRMRTEAEALAARLEGEAATEAARTRSIAQAEASRVRARAEADAATFRAFREQWAKDRAGLKGRLLAQNLARALTGVEEVFLVGQGPVRLRIRRDATSRREEVEAAARWEMFGARAAEEAAAQAPAQGGGHADHGHK